MRLIPITPAVAQAAADPDAFARLTGASNAAGAVEIAYFTFPAYEGRGHGAATAGALVAHAAATGRVRLVYAHTLPRESPSTRILARHGFRRAGAAHDAEAGPVWRWERRLGVLNGRAHGSPVDRERR